VLVAPAQTTNWRFAFLYCIGVLGPRPDQDYRVGAPQSRC
jgi:hypothetical protein